MKKISWPEQVEYLIKRKFPKGINTNIPPTLASISRGNSFSNADYLETIKQMSEYKQVLLEKPQEEVEALYELEKTKEETIRLQKALEEQSRFYNQPSADADFEYWSKMAHWSLDEAIALSFGKNPKIVNWGRLKSSVDFYDFAKQYSDRRDLALRAIPWEKLFDPVTPSIFLSWANELSLELPSMLVDELAKRGGGTSINWLEKFQALDKEYKEYVSATEQKLEDATSNQVKPNADTKSFDMTPLLALALEANINFFSPRKNIDAKKSEVVDWIINEGKKLKPPVSTNIAEAMFTLIKPTDHNPRKRRDN